MNYKTFYIHCVICLLVQLFITIIYQGLPGGSDGKESACNTGDSGSVPGSGRSPGEGNGNPLPWQWQWVCKESDTTAATEHACHDFKLVLTDADCPQVFIYFMYRICIKEKITFFGKKGSQENVDVMAGRERQLIGHPLNHFSGR